MEEEIYSLNPSGLCAVSGIIRDSLVPCQYYFIKNITKNHLNFLRSRNGYEPSFPISRSTMVFDTTLIE
jgi:hypothetical protein